MLFPGSLVSIDIGSQSVKVAQLRERRGAVRAIRFAEQPLPPDFRWEAGADRKPLVEAIRAALAKAGIRQTAAIFALPRRQVTARISAFPGADRGALRRVVEYDLADHIPFPVEQVVVDFHPIGPSRDQPGLTDVMVVAAQRDLVRQYLDLARDLGLRVAALTVDALALDDLVRLAPDGRPGMTLAVEVGARATTINVTETGRLRLTRSVGLGGHQLTLAIRDDLGVSVEEARRLKHTQGLALLDQEVKPERIAAWLENLQGEMRRSALSFGPANVTRVLLVGAAAALPGLPEAIQRDFGVLPLHLTPSALFPQASLQGAASAAERCLLAIAQGLRGIGRSTWPISLVPREVTQLRRARQARRAALAAGVIAGVALIVGYVAAARTLSTHRSRVAALQRRAAQTEKMREKAEAVAEKRQEIRQRLDLLEPAQRRRYLPLELLRAISETAPAGVILSHFTLSPGQPLKIQGRAPNPNAVADLQDGLSRSPLVTGVSLERADQTTQDQATQSLAFTLTVHLWTEEEASARPATFGARSTAR